VLGDLGIVPSREKLLLAVKITTTLKYKLSLMLG
jgi:hypothetical protein